MVQNDSEIGSLDDLYKEIILDHYRAPHNHGTIPNPDISVEDFNPLCGDEITITARVENDTISDIKFIANGCSISQASASMLTDCVKNGEFSKVSSWINIVRDMMHGKRKLSDEELGDLEALKGVSKFPVRIKCAIFPWAALEKGLQEYTNKINKK